MDSESKQAITIKPVNANNGDISKINKFKEALGLPEWDDLNIFQDVKGLSYKNRTHLIAKIGDDVVGYMAYETEGDHFHILQIKMLPGQSKTVGKALLDERKFQLSPNKRNRITMNIREHDDVLCTFLVDYGFKATGTNEDVYKEPRETAYTMEYQPTKFLTDRLLAGLSEITGVQWVERNKVRTGEPITDQTKLQFAAVDTVDKVRDPAQVVRELKDLELYFGDSYFDDMNTASKISFDVKDFPTIILDRYEQEDFDQLKFCSQPPQRGMRR